MTAAMPYSLDDAVGAFQQLGWNGHSKFASGLKVDREFASRDDFKSHVRGFAALEYPIDIDRHAREVGTEACAIGYQATGIPCSTPEHCRHAARRRKFRNAFGNTEEG